MLFRELQQSAAQFNCSLQENGPDRYLLWRGPTQIGEIIGQSIYTQAGQILDAGLREKFQSVLEMYRAYEKAPPLEANSLDPANGFRLLAEYNGVVLAMSDSSIYGPQCATWERTYNGECLWQGHYFNSNYPLAKHDFVVRSGLISEERLMSKEDAAAVAHLIEYVQEAGGPDTADGEEEIRRLEEKILSIAPEISGQSAGPSM